MSKKRIVDLREEQPLLDIVSYGRRGPSTPAQRLLIRLTVHRAPEVMIKVSGGARTLAGVERHMAYVGRDGQLGLDTDTGAHVGGKGFQRSLVREWNLNVDALEAQATGRYRNRKPPKLVHNIIFSMPPGTDAHSVWKAVNKLAANEWALQHRYVMTLHTDDAHPHVHVVLKAVSEQGVRLNIRKATLRTWRAQFAANLRALGVDANATERAVRGESRTRKSDGIYRAHQRGESTHVAHRRQEAIREVSSGIRTAGSDKMRTTRQAVSAGWRALGRLLDARGDHALAEDVRSFEANMRPPRTEQELVAGQVAREKQRDSHSDPTR
jgi:hypothetical protein